MISKEQVQALISGGGNVLGADGSKIGSVGQVYLDDQTSEPEWVTTKTGMFGGAESFVPLAQASVSGNDVRVPFDKEMVKGAPRLGDSNGHLSQDEEAELYRYYGMSYSEATSDSGLPSGDGRASTEAYQDSVGHDTSGPNTDSAMTRSEEQLRVGKEKVTTGKARLRKYVTTENVTQSVPVSHEEVRVHREPITEANRDKALAGGDITSEEHEVELAAERVVVDKETVPVERVRMDKAIVTDEETVSEELRKEQIETDGVDTSVTTGRSDHR